jgi:hypothetical protein
MARDYQLIPCDEGLASDGGNISLASIGAVDNKPKDGDTKVN